MPKSAPCIRCKKSCWGTECRVCYLARLKSALAERFWARVDSSAGPDGCWIWTGGLHHDGYGIILVEGGNKLAHRVAWAIKHGPIQKGKDVLHFCDHPPCVNDAHLFLGNHTINMLDKVVKGRHAKGERHGAAKLTDKAVRNIRLLIQAGHLLREVAAQFGVDESTVSNVARGKTWNHVQ